MVNKLSNLLLDDFLNADLSRIDDEFLQKCPKCKNYMPSFIANCWYCGEILDQDLIRLIKNKT
jgi:hypothetical protein